MIMMIMIMMIDSNNDDNDNSNDNYNNDDDNSNNENIKGIFIWRFFFAQLKAPFYLSCMVFFSGFANFRENEILYNRKTIIKSKWESLL